MNNLQGSKVLVTGGAGFIGHHLVAALVERGAIVRVLDDFSSGKIERLQNCSRQIQIINGDIRDQALVLDAVTDIDIVFHHAAKVSVPESVADPLKTHEVNCTGSLILLDAMVKKEVRRIIFASSCSVYGNARERSQNETLERFPLSPYAATKAAVEMYCRGFAAIHDLDIVILRYFNIYGPGQSDDSPYSGVIAKFVRNFQENRGCTVFGDGSQTRDFVYIDDVVMANLKAATADFKGSMILNVGTGKGRSILDLYHALTRLTGKSLPLEFKPAREGDILHSMADIARTEKVLGYRPRYHFDRGLKELFDNCS